MPALRRLFPRALESTACPSTSTGAGHGSKERLLPLLDEFVAHGCRAHAFDLDALVCRPDAARPAGPWRELGRAELTPKVLCERLEACVRELVERYG